MGFLDGLETAIVEGGKEWAAEQVGEVLPDESREFYEEYEEELSAVGEVAKETILTGVGLTDFFNELSGLSAPPGELSGGKWFFSERKGEVVYYRPSYVFFDIPIEQIPNWMPVDAVFTLLPKLLLDLWKRYQITTADLKVIGKLNPISGIAPVGTDFRQLDPIQQRAFIANAMAIAAAKNYANSTKFKQIYETLREKEKQLGWHSAEHRGMLILNDTQLVQTGKDKYGKSLFNGQPLTTAGIPLTNMESDIKTALERLHTAQEGHSIPGAARTMQAQEFEACFAEGIGPEEAIACVEGFQSDPGTAVVMDNFFHPWKATHVKGKLLDFPIGIDGKRYVVVEVGGKPVWAKTVTFTASTGAAIGLSALAVGAYFLLKTDTGQNLKEAILGK
jgi:hypothetical protein